MRSRMRALLARMWREDSGVLSFEWVMLSSLLTFGIVSGIAGARDAIVDELGDVSEAMLSLDQSYSIDFPLKVHASLPNFSGSSDSSFQDALDFDDDSRTNDGDQPKVLTQRNAEDSEA